MRTLALFLATALLAVAGCGGSSEKSGSTTGQKAATSGPGSPSDVIQRWFTAARLGKASDKCALESTGYQVGQDERAGEACLANPANAQPQPVWAKRTAIVKLTVSGSSATATVRPNAGSSAEATVELTRVGGRWLVDAFH
jgi:hypothetical protein